MSNQFQRFKELHEQPEPLLIGNVWNAQSAKIFESLGYKAIATSSSAVAETLGYADGEQISFAEYVFIIKHIAASVSIPLSVDLEAGYGKITAEIVENIKELSGLGVSGINIEDSTLENGTRKISDPTLFFEKIRSIILALEKTGIEVFINLRSDAFLLDMPDSLSESQKRISLYQSTGAHGLFFPCVTKIEDIKALTKMSTLPINVMCMPALPDFTALQKAGVKRISMGGFLNRKIYRSLQEVAETVLEEKSFACVF